VIEEPLFNEGFPDKWTAEVTVETVDGRRLVGRGDMPEGEWVNPVLPARVEAKAKDLLGSVMHKASAAALVSRVAALETVADTRAMLPEIGDASAPLRAVAE
jgi:hypothetical protein